MWSPVWPKVFLPRFHRFFLPHAALARLHGQFLVVSFECRPGRSNRSRSFLSDITLPFRVRPTLQSRVRPTVQSRLHRFVAVLFFRILTRAVVALRSFSLNAVLITSCGFFSCRCLSFHGSLFRMLPSRCFMVDSRPSRCFMVDAAVSFGHSVVSPGFVCHSTRFFLLHATLALLHGRFSVVSVECRPGRSNRTWPFLSDIALLFRVRLTVQSRECGPRWRALCTESRFWRPS